MKRLKFSAEQIVCAIRRADASTSVGDFWRQLGVSDATFYAWKKKYAYLGVSELRRLRQLEEENSRLKRLVADLSFDKHMLVICVIRRHPFTLFRPGVALGRVVGAPSLSSSEPPGIARDQGRTWLQLHPKTACPHSSRVTSR